MTRREKLEKLKGAIENLLDVSKKYNLDSYISDSHKTLPKELKGIQGFINDSLLRSTKEYQDKVKTKGFDEEKYLTLTIWDDFALTLSKRPYLGEKVNKKKMLLEEIEDMLLKEIRASHYMWLHIETANTFNDIISKHHYCFWEELVSEKYPDLINFLELLVSHFCKIPNSELFVPKWGRMTSFGVDNIIGICRAAIFIKRVDFTKHTINEIPPSWKDVWSEDDNNMIKQVTNGK